MKFSLNKKLATAVALGFSSVGAFAATGIAVPTPDYTSFYSIAGVAIAVSLIVMLAKRAKSFLR